MYEALRGKSVLVTGGAGFIGSHLVARLVEEQAARVVVLDSLRYGDPANLGQSRAVELVKHTLGTDDASRLRDALGGIDYVFHLAAEKHNQSKDTPAAVLQANIDGTLGLLEAAASAGVKKVVYTSSLYAYGRMTPPIFDEGDVPAPNTVYGITKLAGEHLCAYAKKQHGLPFNVLRYLFIYGPKQFAGMGYKSVIIKNFERIMNGEPPVVFGDGQQTLDYVHVDDAVEATLRALVSPHEGEVFNVATGRGVTVLELVQTMLRVAKSDLELTYGPADWTAGTVRVGSAAKIEELLGWRAGISIEEGLQRTYEWLASTR